MNIFYSIKDTQYIFANNKILANSALFWTVNGQNLNNYEIIGNEPIFFIENNKKRFYSLFLVNISNCFLHWWVSNIDIDNNYSEIWLYYYMEKNVIKQNDINHFVFYLCYSDDIMEKSNDINSYDFRVKFKKTLGLLKMKNWLNKYNLKIIKIKYFNLLE